MANEGWIKLHRKILDCWIWNSKPYDKARAWIDLLLLANHADKKILFNGSVVTISKGQYLTSIRKLSARWEWSYDKCLRFLNLLETEEMLRKESDNTRTLLTIVNYEVYQDVPNTNKCTNRTPISEPAEHQQVTNKNEKNVKNVKNNKYTCAFEELWSVYPRRKEKAKAYKCYQARLSDGYSEDELLLAVKRYAQECKAKNTEEQFIKHAATFLGPNTPFLDYLGDYKPSAQKKENKFNNFEGRTYDMSSLEEQLLNRK